MDGMTEKIEQFLSDPSAISQIQQVLSSLGSQDPDSSGGLDLSSLFGMFSGGGMQNDDSSPTMGGLGSLGGLGDLGGIASLLGSFQNNDNNENAVLLLALRPFLSSGRQKRVGEAVQLMKILALLPLLKESGLLSGILGGDSYR